MKLIAITAVKYGKGGETAQPGEALDVDTDTAKALIGAGAAATPQDYERARTAAKAPEQRVAELEAENAELRAETAALKEALEAKGRGKG